MFELQKVGFLAKLQHLAAVWIHAKGSIINKIISYLVVGHGMVQNLPRIVTSLK